jgi:phage-related protein
LCKIKYPVITAQAASTATVGSATVTLTGTPLSWILPKVVGASTYSSNGTIVNSGDLSSYPNITIYGPINLPKLTNSTTGEYIEVSQNLASSSDSMIISYDQDTLSISVAGSSVLGSLTSGSTLFKIRSGTNSFTLTGSTMGSGAYATVTTYSSWPLS